MTHKIAKDLEKADRKRKAEEEEKEIANQHVDQEGYREEGPSKKAKPAQEEEMDIEINPEGASSSGLAGGATGAPGETLKRKREETDSDPGIDIDCVETLGNMLSRSSIIDPELERWSNAVNDKAKMTKQCLIRDRHFSELTG